MPALRVTVPASFQFSVTTLSSGNFGCNVQASKAVASVQQVMSPAQQTNVLGVSCATPGKGFYVIELDERSRLAAPTVGRDECALPAISAVCLSSYRDR